MTSENRDLNALEPGDDPDFGVAAEGPLQAVVGLEAAVVQARVVAQLLAGGSADVHVQHKLQALHYLDEGLADVRLLE